MLGIRRSVRCRLLFLQHSDHAQANCPVPASQETKTKTKTQHKCGAVPVFRRGEFGAGSPQGRFPAPLVWSWGKRTGWLTSGWPPNKALLRKRHQQQPRQRAWRRETRTNAPSQPVFPSSEQVEARGSAVAPLLRLSLSSVRSLLFPISFRCVSVFASHAWQQSGSLFPEKIG